MSLLDTPSTPNPSTVSNQQLILKYGAIWGGVSILITLVGFLTNTDPALPTTGSIKWIYSVIGIGIAIWAIVMAIKVDRDQQLGGFISLGRCIGLGFKIGLVAGLIGAVFMLLYTGVINPGFADQMREAMIASFEEKGMGEEEIEMALKMSSMFTNPIALAISQVLFNSFFGFLVGLIAGAAMKKDRPYTA